MNKITNGTDDVRELHLHKMIYSYELVSKIVRTTYYKRCNIFTKNYLLIQTVYTKKDISILYYYCKVMPSSIE